MKILWVLMGHFQKTNYGTFSFNDDNLGTGNSKDM